MLKYRQKWAPEVEYGKIETIYRRSQKNSR